MHLGFQKEAVSNDVCIPTCPCNICIIQIGFNIREIYNFKRVLIGKLAYTIE